MEGLSKYFQKIKLVLQDKTEEKKIIQSVIQDLAGVTIDFENIVIKHSVATLTLSPIERVEITIKKKQIVSELRKKGVIITDFR